MEDHKDNLEDFFSRMFNDGQKVNQPDSWNEPSEEVWNHIEQEVQPKKEPKPKLIFFYWTAVAASFLLLISIGFLVNYRKKIQDLSQKLDENKQEVLGIKGEIKQLRAHEIEKELSTDDIATSKIPSQKNSPLQLQQSTVNSLVIKNSSLNSQEKGTAQITEPTLLANKLKPSAIGLDKTPFLELTKIATLSPKEMDIAIREVASFPKFEFPTKPQKETKFYLALATGPHFQELITSGTTFDPPFGFPRLNVEQENNYVTSLLVGWKIGKNWSIESGLNYLVNSRKINHSHRIPFGALNEQLNNAGNYQSTINLRGQSSFGDIETNIILARSTGETLPVNENLNLSLDFRQQFSFLEIPFLIKKEFSFNRFSLGLKGGVLNRFLVHDNVGLQNISISDDRFQPESKFAEVSKKRNGPRVHNLHYQLGASIDYAILPKWSIFTESQYNKSILPIAEFGNANVFVENVGLQLGIRYHL